MRSCAARKSSERVKSCAAERRPSPRVSRHGRPLRVHQVAAGEPPMPASVAAMRSRARVQEGGGRACPHLYRLIPTYTDLHRPYTDLTCSLKRGACSRRRFCCSARLTSRSALQGPPAANEQVGRVSCGYFGVCSGQLARAACGAAHAMRAARSVLARRERAAHVGSAIHAAGMPAQLRLRGRQIGVAGTVTPSTRRAEPRRVVPLLLARHAYVNTYAWRQPTRTERARATNSGRRRRRQLIDISTICE